MGVAKEKVCIKQASGRLQGQPAISLNTKNIPFYGILLLICFAIWEYIHIFVADKRQIIDMRVISQKKIKDFYGQPQHEQAKIPLQQWYYTIRNRDYRSFAQILVDFGDTVREKGLYVFSIGEGKYKVAASIYFDTGCVYVRFVGSASDWGTS